VTRRRPAERRCRYLRRATGRNSGPSCSPGRRPRPAGDRRPTGAMHRRRAVARADDRPRRRNLRLLPDSRGVPGDDTDDGSTVHHRRNDVRLLPHRLMRSRVDTEHDSVAAAGHGDDDEVALRTQHLRGQNVVAIVGAARENKGKIDFRRPCLLVRGRVHRENLEVVVRRCGSLAGNGHDERGQHHGPAAHVRDDRRAEKTHSGAGGAAHSGLRGAHDREGTARDGVDGEQPFRSRDVGGSAVKSGRWRRSERIVHRRAFGLGNRKFRTMRRETRRWIELWKRSGGRGRLDRPGFAGQPGWSASAEHHCHRHHQRNDTRTTTLG
jgi:hypothetical protein